jgi:putative transposase
MRLKTPRRRKSAVVRTERPTAIAVNQTWSMDFMADNLAYGRKIRLLSIVDNFSRECLALEVAAGFKGTDVAQVLTHIVSERGRPREIRCDTALSSYLRHSISGHIGTRFSSTSRGPESRQTMLSLNRSTVAYAKNCSTRAGSNRLEKAREMAAAWRAEYNEHRPHRSLGNSSPAEFARAAAAAAS